MSRLIVLWLIRAVQATRHQRPYADRDVLRAKLEAIQQVQLKIEIVDNASNIVSRKVKQRKTKSETQTVK
jgi:hypothetical protein